MAYRLSRAAEDQLDTILLESVRVHGLAASDRYNVLLLAAMSAVGTNPRLLGSSDVPRVPGIRAYPARLSRARHYAASRVRAPRHVIPRQVRAREVQLLVIGSDGPGVAPNGRAGDPDEVELGGASAVPESAAVASSARVAAGTTARISAARNAVGRRMVSAAAVMGLLMPKE